MTLIFTTKRFIFRSPEIMQDKMMEYLYYVQKQNADYTQKFCKNCGAIITDMDAADCCDDPRIEFNLIHKPTYEHMRPTLYGFAAYCGISISTFYGYKNKEGFDDVLDWFKTVLQMDLEQLLLNPFNRNVGGAKFVAINNFGWKDKQYIEQTGTQQVTFVNDIGLDMKEDEDDFDRFEENPKIPTT